MKTWVSTGLAAVILLSATSCRKLDSEADGEEKSGFPEMADVLDALPGRKEKEPERIPLPVDRVLTDSQGRELDATVIGRNSLRLTVVRRADEARFDIAIEDLSVEDQAWARTLTFQAVPLESDGTDGAGSGAPKEVPPYIKSREERIAHLEERIVRYKSMGKSSSNTIMRKEYISKVIDMKKEIDELKTDIQTYDYRRGD